MDVILIPAYEPDAELIKLVDEFYSHDFKIVVVNDGSGKNYDNIFEEIKQKCDIVCLEKNSGKGAALKAGMKYIKENLPECEHFITCDADGQHQPSDVLRVKEQLAKGHKFVLTIRKRQGKIPFRSRFGNDLSKVVYALLTNRYLADNQSGLRGFDISNLDWLLKVEKNNYDYEMNVLYYAAKMGLKITTLTIDAIYIENNASSHFQPVADTVRIYKSLFSLARASLIGFLSAVLFVIIGSLVLPNRYLWFIIPTAGAISSVLCILLNKYLFFKNTPLCEFKNTLVYTGIMYFIYTLVAALFAAVCPQIPLSIIFFAVYILCLPLRFFMHQLIYIASFTKE